ncbi:hypothetical protein DYB37_004189 [Aphanomyces astaci]|uniref:MYND-type domain-containing protein n=1 Tax=Aphanomyces astaci TaxID=112090 RepID=A0A418F2N6_APHAT|nr:hypothetical protein DYB37_004189 [Aphanomyces astaci]
MTVQYRRYPSREVYVRVLLAEPRNTNHIEVDVGDDKRSFEMSFSWPKDLWDVDAAYGDVKAAHEATYDLLPMINATRLAVESLRATDRQPPRTKLSIPLPLFPSTPSLGMNGEMDKVVADLGRKVKESVKKLTKKQRMNLNKSPADHLTSASVKSAGTALPAYAELRQWRDTCRTWCDKLYSRAIPHPAAFKAIKALGPIVEMGAGLGYWHSLMDQHKIDALAFDPTATAKWSPKTGEDDAADDPDGNEEDVAASTGLPRWSTVYQGNADILDSVPALKPRTLFLCAPPKTSFARDCLRHYKGRHLIHVGEWYGDTGDRQFECDVMKAFALTSRVPLPNWGDTAFELTVWERKTKANQPSLPVVACAVCESRHRSLLRRCSLCKTTVYCSADCMRQHTAVHTAEHARRLVFLNHDDLLDFDNPHHFHPFEWDMHANDDFKAAASWSTTAKEDATFSFKF